MVVSYKSILNNEVGSKHFDVTSSFLQSSTFHITLYCNSKGPPQDILGNIDVEGRWGGECKVHEKRATHHLLLGHPHST
jgi:hypothetical protein